MPRYSNFPTVIEDLLCLTISFLKKHNYLAPYQHKTGTVHWSTNGKETASIRIAVHLNEESGILELSYNYRDEPVNYKIRMISKPSNLGKGSVWYFVCPNTGKLCRKLYGQKYFLHREAYIGIMYQKQTESKKYRQMDKIYGPYFDSEKLYEELYKPYFKKYYNGKPTKRYLKIRQQLEQTENVSTDDIEKLLMLGF